MWEIRNIEKILEKILYKTKFLEDLSADEIGILNLISLTYGGSYQVDFSGWNTIQ